MRTVAFLCSGDMFPENPDRREDWWELKLEFEPMQAACARRGIRLRLVRWDDTALRPDEFDAFVIGTAWDYTDKPEHFLRTLEDLQSRRPLFNSTAVVRWNMHKSYLRDLAARDVPVVPTLWRKDAGSASVCAAFDELGCDEIVIKPVVGASAWRQVRLRRGEPLPPALELPPAETMIQPYLRAAAQEGEYSFVFFGRDYSHCALKVPAAGDYRTQSMYGAVEQTHHPTPEEIAAARSALRAAPEPVLYGRVDMMRDDAGRLTLMELELIEPYLYPEQGEHMGERFAAALASALSGSPLGG